MDLGNQPLVLTNGCKSVPIYTKLDVGATQRVGLGLQILVGLVLVQLVLVAVVKAIEEELIELKEVFTDFALSCGHYQEDSKDLVVDHQLLVLLDQACRLVASDYP